jgi:ABC-2 type transport system permease protein
MQYKMDFIASSITYGLIMVIDYLLLSLILYRFDHVKGWGIYEIGLLYGIASVGISLYRMFAPEIHDFERYMIHGEFDSLLIRPVSPLFLLLSRNLDLNRIGGVFQGILILGVSLWGLYRHGSLTLLLIIYLPISLITAMIICLSLGLMTATVAFWIQQVKELQVFTIYAPYNAANYPINIYPAWLKALFFTVIPVAFVNYVPVIYLLEKGGKWYYLILSPAVALLLFFISLSFWNIGIRHYHSTGS